MASLLVQNLIDHSWVDDEKGPRKELTIMMDNCAGQNKNNMVIRLALLLSEWNYYTKVNIAFYIAGHTKNSCDRLFNVLKQTYRKTNIYTMEQMLEELNKNRLVTAVQALEANIADYNAFEDKVYKQLVSGTIKQNHMFCGFSKSILALL